MSKWKPRFNLKLSLKAKPKQVATAGYASAAAQVAQGVLSQCDSSMTRLVIKAALKAVETGGEDLTDLVHRLKKLVDKTRNLPSNRTDVQGDVENLTKILDRISHALEPLKAQSGSYG